MSQAFVLILSDKDIKIFNAAKANKNKAPSDGIYVTP